MSPVPGLQPQAELPHARVTAAPIHFAQPATPRAPAEASTELGVEQDPAPALAYALTPAFARWPRATPAALLIALLAAWGLAGRWDIPPEPEPSAHALTAQAQPGDGFPPALLLAIDPTGAGTSASAPQAQP